MDDGTSAKTKTGSQMAKPQLLSEIAAFDPKLAMVLLRAGKVSSGRVGEASSGHLGVISSGGYVDSGGWEIINLPGTFIAGPAGTVVKANLNGIIEADLWVRRVTYTVRRPNAFAGNILKAQSDYYNRLNPNIDFTLQINSYCKYMIAPDFTPLENIETVFECVCPAGLVLRCSSTIIAQYINNLPVAGDLIPTNVVITLHATRLPMEAYGQCGGPEAIMYLRREGYLPGECNSGE